MELHCLNDSINRSGRISVVEADFHFLTQSLLCRKHNRIGKITAKELKSFKLTWDNNAMGKAPTLGGKKIQEAYC